MTPTPACDNTTTPQPEPQPFLTIQATSKASAPALNRQPSPLLNVYACYELKATRARLYASDPWAQHKYINVPLALQLLNTRKPHLQSIGYYSPPRQRHRSVQSVATAKPLKQEKITIRVRDMPSSCKDIRAALAQCLQESDCVMIHRNSPADCLRSPLLETMPNKCQQLKSGYGQCKRGMVDMRKRFRGNQPIAVSRELEGVSGDVTVGGGQLYAGKSAFGGGVKETAGNEPEEKDWREVENEKLRKN